MRPYTAVGIAVADSLAMFAIIAYGTSMTELAEKDTIMFSLLFYLTMVMVILSKISVWALVISACIHEEREEREDTRYEYRYRDGIVVPDMDKIR